MTDDLRTRIAAAIREVDDMRVCKLSDADIKFIVDAVIRELGLQQEFSVGDDEGGRVLWLDGEEPVTPREGEVVESRWISRWERDE